MGTRLTEPKPPGPLTPHPPRQPGGPAAVGGAWHIPLISFPKGHFQALTLLEPSHPCPRADLTSDAATPHPTPTPEGLIQPGLHPTSTWGAQAACL